MSLKLTIFSCGNCILSAIHCRRTSYNSVKHALHDKLLWLPIMHRFKFKVWVFGYKATNRLAPPYLNKFFIPISSNSALNRNKSAALEYFIVPFATRNITYRRQSFAVSLVLCLCLILDSICIHLSRLQHLDPLTFEQSLTFADF